MTTSAAQLIVREQRVTKVLALVGAEPRTLKDLGRALSVGETTVRHLLIDMKQDKQIHLTRYDGKWCYALGDSPDIVEFIREPVFEFTRPVLKTWSLHLVRDELVSALFGPAREVA